MAEKNTFETLLAKIEQVTESGCWIFMGHCNRDGYARVRFKGKQIKAHRLFYENFIGPIPSGLVLDHICRVRCCVRPDHLEPVTNRTNTLRGIGVTAQNYRKTHCKNGHLFDLVIPNPVRMAAVQRVCSFCRIANEKKKVMRRTMKRRITQYA